MLKKNTDLTHIISIHKFWQRLFCIVFITIALNYKVSAADKISDKPNIVLILADDLGYNDLSCYREFITKQSEEPPTCQTPSLDSLAKRGMLFTDFYAGAPVCSPSRAALLTGRNHCRTGIYNWIPKYTPMHLRSEEITIAEILRNNGYETGHFGKWHLTSEWNATTEEEMTQPRPNDQGFDYSFFTYNNAVPNHNNPTNFLRNGKPVGPLKGYACQLVVDEAIDWLDNKHDPDDPFYINVWFNEPHLKLAAPEELTKRHKYNSKYYGAIENMDIAVGRLIKKLNEMGMLNNTIIIFSSDNGSKWNHSNDPLRGKKGLTYEGGICEPFIVSWPGFVPEGTVSNYPASFTDILPTLCEATSSKIPEDRKIDGVNILPVFIGEKDSVEREIPIFFFRYSNDPICMLRIDNWCLLGYRDKSNADSSSHSLAPGPFVQTHMELLKDLEPTYFELYDLKKDKEEKYNIIAEYQEQAQIMKTTMMKLRREVIIEGGDWFKE